MNGRELNRVKKIMKCLRCGRDMLTDRCHRICAVCKRRNYKQRDLKVYPNPRKVAIPR